MAFFTTGAYKSSFDAYLLPSSVDYDMDEQSLHLSDFSTGPQTLQNTIQTLGDEDRRDPDQNESPLSYKDLKLDECNSAEWREIQELLGCYALEESVLDTQAKVNEVFFQNTFPSCHLERQTLFQTSTKSMPRIERPEVSQEECRSETLDSFPSSLESEIKKIAIRSPHWHCSLIHLLGSGTFGLVYASEFNSVFLDQQKQVAVKITIPSETYDPEDLKLSIKEANVLKMLAQLDPMDEKNVARYIDAAILNESQMCIIQDLYDMNLAQFIMYNKHKGISLDRVAQITEQILQGLEYLQSLPNPMIHCDLKPANILVQLSPYPKIRISDFGSSLFIGLENTQGLYRVTRNYRPPEVQTQNPLTLALDMWSLGCISIELHARAELFRAKSSTDLIHQQASLFGPLSLRLAEQLSGKEVAFDLDPETPGYVKIRKLTKYSSACSRALKIFATYTSVQGKRSCYSLKRDEKVHSIYNYSLYSDFLRSLFHLEPKARPLPLEALQHPFILQFRRGNPFAASASLPVKATDAFK